jgi:hypothetical protein
MCVVLFQFSLRSQPYSAQIPQRSTCQTVLETAEPVALTLLPEEDQRGKQ